MQDFEYIDAHSVAEVVGRLARDGDETGLLSGGTDLLVQLREGRRRATLIVDIKNVPEASRLTYDAGQGLYLGAAVSCRRICNDPLVAAAYPGLIDAVSLIGGIQIQGRASVGGNLCNASPAADTIPALIVHRAECLIAGTHGQRTVPVEDFCTGPGRTVLEHDEMLLALRIPPPAPGFGAAYLRFIPRNEMDIAVVGVGAAVVLDESRTRFVSARIALGAVAPTPLFVPEAGAWLAGQPVSENTLAEAARIAQAAARPIDDLRGTRAQRTHLTGVLTRRALERAAGRGRLAQTLSGATTTFLT